MNVCAQCGGEFFARRPHARFCSDACRAITWKANASEKSAERVLDHPLDLVRGDAEESAEKARWTLIVREQIARTLMATGYFSVKDLEPLGIPAEHVNVCTSQIGSFASSKYMAKLTWHKSEKTSRKGGPYWTFQITERGRERLAALLQDIRSELAGLDTHNPEGSAAEVETQGAAPSTGRGPSPFRAIPHGAGSSVSVESGDPGAHHAGAVGAGQANGKGDQGGFVSTPSAGTDTPDHIHHGHLPATSPYSGENEFA